MYGVIIGLLVYIAFFVTRAFFKLLDIESEIEYLETRRNKNGEQNDSKRADN